MKVYKPKNLLLFTSSYPFGRGEQFLETEIHYLAEAFNTIKIYPLDFSGEPRALPDNVMVVNHHLYRPHNRLKTLLKNFHLILQIYINTIILTRHRIKYFKNFTKDLNNLLHRFNDSIWLENELKNNVISSTVIYSYWFNLWMTVFTLIKLKGKAPFNIITRVHGGDFDEQQRPLGYFPFREIEIKFVGNIYSASKYGCDYLLKQYPRQKNIGVSRLGVKHHGDNPYKPGKNYFHIVSCSFIYPLKRVHLIVEILANLKEYGYRLKWTHFGDGPLFEDIKKQVRKLNSIVDCECKGFVPNHLIIEYYKTHPVDLFLTTSELEGGNPVSIQEAISFGIPALGCDTSGVSEIISHDSGFLMDLNFKPAYAAEIIAEYFNSPTDNQLRIRREVKELWNTKFNADKNYSNFVSEISK